MEAARTFSRSIRVIVVGEDPLVRRGLRSVLEDAPDVSIVAETDDSVETLRTIAKLMPDILVMAVTQLDEDAFQFISRVRADFSKVNVVLTGMAVDKASLLMAVESGAFGFVPSGARSEEFASVFREALAGRSPVMAQLAGELLFHALTQLHGDIRDHEHSLSTREHEVLQRMVCGMSNKEIGADLHISVGTVKAHVSNVLRKLGAADRTQAVIKAIRQGLVEL